MTDQTLQMTAVAYRNLPQTDEYLQLIEGELVASASPTDPHQLVCINSTLYLGTRMGARQLRYEMDLYIDDVNVPRPDIFWISDDNTNCVLKDGYWHGAPDLIVEVLSPSTAKHDRGAKYQVYERNGVREYWIIDPHELFIEVYALENQRYVRAGFYERGHTFTSRVLEIHINVDALFDGL